MRHFEARSLTLAIPSLLERPARARALRLLGVAAAILALNVTLLLLIAPAGVQAAGIPAPRPPNPPRVPITRAEAPILLYHHVAKGNSSWFVTPDRFEAQMRYLVQAGYHAITISEYLNAVATRSLAPKTVVVTFDDGYDDLFSNAFPILQRYGLKGTFYIITGRVGTPGYLTWDQIRAMQSAGMEIGAHTYTHPFLTRQPPVAVLMQILLSQIQITAELGAPPVTFAYPYNDRNRAVERFPALLGFRAALAVSPHTGDRQGDLYTIPRITVTQGETPRTFAMVLARGY